MTFRSEIVQALGDFKDAVQEKQEGVVEAEERVLAIVDKFIDVSNEHGDWAVEHQCYFCKQPTNNLAADPGQWSLSFCYDSNGKALKFHTSCVTERLHQLDNMLAIRSLVR